MTTQEQKQKFLDLGRRAGFWRRGVDFPRLARQIFGTDDLRGRSLLEIGCGKGVFCLWAAMHGAVRTVGLEPMSDGFYDEGDFQHTFMSLASELGVEGVSMETCTLQQYAGAEASFDYVLSVASINHLDEPACIDLHTNGASRQKYIEVFTALRRLMKSGGELVILDSSRRNLFGDMGMKSPFQPQIEWHKHQLPEVWVDILAVAGFGQAEVTWLGNRALRYLGLPNIPRPVAYCMDSSFRLELRAL